MAQTGAVEQMQGVSRVDLVAAHVVEKLAVRVDEHFKGREAAGQAPWPEGGKAKIAAIRPEDYASGNYPDLEEAMKGLSGDERAQLVQKVQQHLANHGYSSHIDDDITAQRLDVTLWDPHWNPFPVYQRYWPPSKHMYQFQPDPQGWVHDHFISHRHHARVFYNVATKEYEVRDVGHWDRNQPQISGPGAQACLNHAKRTIFNDTLKPV